jgi:restriction system protein
VARKNRSILNELVRFPWWVSVGLAGVVYAVSVFVLPELTLASPVLKNLPSGLARVGPFVSLLLLGVAAVSAFFQFRKGKLLEQQTGLDSVGELSWRQFESLVSEAFRRKGFLVLDNIEDGPDGGVDLRLRKNGQVVFVQCKHWKARSVGVKVVRELYGVMAAKNVKQGIVVTYGAFTPETMEFAKANAIALIDGPKLTQMIASVQQSGNMQARSEVARASPKCGSEIVL